MLPTSDAPNVAERYKQVVHSARVSKGVTTALRDRPATITPDRLLAAHHVLRDAAKLGEDLLMDADLIAYAAQQVGDPAYRLDEAFQEAYLAGQAVTEWIETYLGDACVSHELIEHDYVPIEIPRAELNALDPLLANLIAKFA